MIEVAIAIRQELAEFSRNVEAQQLLILQDKAHIPAGAGGEILCQSEANSGLHQMYTQPV